MEIVLVRHGQPAWVVDGLARNDPDLTELGVAQASAAGTRFGDATHPSVDRLLASPARRAQQTAAPLAAALALEIETLDWLLEIRNPPAWEGQPIEVVQQAFGQMATRTREESWGGLPGGESFRDFHARITGGIDALLGSLGITPTAEAALWSVPEDQPVERLVLVAHGGTNSTIVAHLLNVSPEPWEWERFAMGHASVAVLATTAVGGAHIWSLLSLGDAAHLDRGGSHTLTGRRRGNPAEAPAAHR